VSEKSLRNGANHGFLVPARAVSRTTGDLALEPMQKDRERRRMGVYWPVADKAKWKFPIKSSRRLSRPTCSGSLRGNSKTIVAQ
jgi:hypothetical protein